MDKHIDKQKMQEDILKALDACYERTKLGIGKISPPVSQMAENYLKKEKDTDTAIKSMLKYQVVKCTTSGFITGFGGAITLPITIPANVGSVLYVQMRMIACTAYMAGYDLNSDQVQTFVYAVLAGVSVNEVLKKFGVKLGQKLAQKGIEKIPGKVLIKINQKIGFRLLTKFGEKGLLNIGKAIPVVGAAVQGVLDLAETRIIANRAYKLFVEGIDANETPEDVYDLDSDILSAGLIDAEQLEEL